MSTQRNFNAALLFGAFMVIVYLAVGILCLVGVFSNIFSHGISIALGILLIVYSIWRAYRLAMGGYYNPKGPRN